MPVTGGLVEIASKELRVDQDFAAFRQLRCLLAN